MPCVFSEVLVREEKLKQSRTEQSRIGQSRIGQLTAELPTWFLRLRLFAFFGQILVLSLAVAVFGLSLRWGLIASILSVIPATNLIAIHLLRRDGTSRWNETSVVGSLLVIDTILLSATLYESGGPTNPFSIVYLLHIVLAAVLLTPRLTWAITALCSLFFAALFIDSRPIPEWHGHDMHHGFSLHLHGMFFAFVTVAVLSAYFLNRIITDLRRKERELERFENLALNQRRLAALTTLSAGAAHELGTPLGTIAVVGHEIEQTIREKFPNPSLLEDLALLKTETTRCKQILEELGEKAGDVIGEMPVETDPCLLIRDSLLPLRTSPGQVKIDCRCEHLLFELHRKALSRALRSLVQNALDASPNSSPVVICCDYHSGLLTFEITDSGEGIDTEISSRIGEPFFSTKAPEGGMGLGVYVSRLTAEQFGGALEIESVPGAGTRATLSIPVEVARRRVHA